MSEPAESTESQSRANRILLGVFIALLFALIPLAYLLYVKRTSRPVTYALLFPETPRAIASLVSRIPKSRVEKGKQLANRHCGTCHLVPPPDVLPRRVWVPALKNMAARMGLAKTIVGLAKEEYGLLQDLKRIGGLPEPELSLREFRDIAHYYYARASEKPRPQEARPAPQPGGPFRVGRMLEEKSGALHDMTLVRIDSRKKRIYVGALITPRTQASVGSPPVHMSRLEEYTNRLRLVKSVAFDSPPVHMGISAREKLLTTLGGPPFGPGRVWKLSAGGGEWRTMLKKSHRLTHAREADLDGDGRAELIVSGFGFNAGALAWYSASGKEHILSAASGGIRTEVRDVNGDGRPDIIALMAQAREGIYIHINQGAGRFRPQAVVERHAAFGYTHLELADLNGDGQPDLITTNGDNGDFPNPPLKYFHGVRIHLSRGAAYEQSWFYPLHGAYKVLARDFDLDGDLDLAVIALYDDAKRRPRENFVYLENTGGPKAPSFRPYAVGGLDNMVPGVMDAGDLDGDGDLDLVLGSLQYLSNPALSEAERGRVKRSGPAPPMLVVLENRSR